ncbi:hypothetical protein [Sphingomonas sp.]|uniref:hypothetical protein n=1 Tax=Sphingomonas sp. TaxID=28214 RepID=UPI00286E0A96|nr:hypothetical protein [Sphingomonas sp.]
MSSVIRLIVAAFLLALAGPAFAQATRTWVSGVGDDVNPCSRTAPCKTFAGAISKTAAGGEINCLDPGGFGTLTITKSITVDCSGTFGSTLNSGGINGFVINDSLSATPGTAKVVLRGLSINGAGTTPGLNGIRFLSGRELVVENVFIQNQGGGNGISLQPSALMRFQAENVTVAHGAGGILIQPTGANGAIRATMRNVRVRNNSGIGLSVLTTGNTAAGGNVVAIDKCSFASNSSGIAVNAAAGTTSATVMIYDTLLANNSTGLSATGTLARARIGQSVITGNSTGVSVTGGAAINTYATNMVDGNTTDGTFTLPAILQE